MLAVIYTAADSEVFLQSRLSYAYPKVKYA